MSYFLCDGCDKKHFLFGKDGGTLLAKKFRTDLLAQLPLVPGIREGGDEGRPVASYARDTDTTSGVAQEFMTLARKVAQKISILDRESAEVGGITIGKF